MQQPPNSYPQYPQPQWQQPPEPPQQQWNPQQQPQYQPPMPPPKKNSKRFIALVVGIVVATVLFGCIGMSALASMKGQTAQQTATNQSSVTQAVQQQPTQATQQPTLQPTLQPTSKPTPKPTLQPTPKPTTVPTPTIDQRIDQIVQNAGLSGNNIKSLYNIGGDNYEKIEEDLGDGNLTNGLTVTEIHMDCFNVQKALWTQEKSHLSEVEVVMTMNVVDQYGNESNEMVGDCDLKSTTEQLFNWSNLDQDSAWQDYDNTFIAPFLLQ